jgi:hypothetical protein
MRRSTAVGVAVSLLLHVAALLFIVPKIMKEQELTAPESRAPLTARLRLREPAAAPATPARPSEPTPPPPEPTPTPPKKPTRRPPVHPPQRPPVLSQNGPSGRRVPKNEPPPKEPPPKEPPKKDFGPLPKPFDTPPNDNSPDFSANLHQNQGKRDENDARNGTPAGGNNHPNAPDLDSIIAKNLAPRSDKNGIFSIRDIGVRTASIYFRGWGNDPRRWRGEQFDVDAGPGGNVENAVIAQVIRIIRRDYPEMDFQWESFRLGKVLTKSSRRKDTAELSAFLKQELFSGY